MGTEAADSIGQGSAGIGSSTSTSTDVAADMVSEHRTAGTLDTTALAADVRAHAPDDPQVQADLAAAIEAQLTPPSDVTTLAPITIEATPEPTPQPSPQAAPQPVAPVNRVGETALQSARSLIAGVRTDDWPQA